MGTFPFMADYKVILNTDGNREWIPEPVSRSMTTPQVLSSCKATADVEPQEPSDICEIRVDFTSQSRFETRFNPARKVLSAQNHC